MDDASLSLDFDIGDLGFDLGEIDLGAFDFSIDTGDAINSRYIKPPAPTPVKQENIRYEYAADLAKDLDIGSGTRHFAIVSGNFIFGDFIEALFVEKSIHAPRMVINTLSLSQENIDSLANLLNGGYVGKLDLIVSSYFYAHERGKEGLIPYIYEKLDIDDRFQLAVAGTHCKTVTFTTMGGKSFVIHGSANLRSSRCLEQIVIEESAELREFNDTVSDIILAKFATIKKDLRSKALWKEIDNG